MGEGLLASSLVQLLGRRLVFLVGGKEMSETIEHGRINLGGFSETRRNIHNRGDSDSSCSRIRGGPLKGAASC